MFCAVVQVQLENTNNQFVAEGNGVIVTVTIVNQVTLARNIVINITTDTGKFVLTQDSKNSQLANSCNILVTTL